MKHESSTFERLLRLHEQLPDPSVLNLSYALGLDGPLDIEGLREALVMLVETFPQLGDATTRRDSILRQLDFDGDEAKLPVVVQSEREMPFDLNSDPLVRATIVELTPTKNLLLLSFHHAAADGWSLEMYCRTLSRTYEAFVEGRPFDDVAVVPASPVLASSDRCSLLVGEGTNDLRDSLRGIAPRAVDVFGDTNEGSGGLLTWTQSVDEPFIRAVRALALTRKVTPFTLVVAAIANKLGTALGLDDLVLGTTVAGRSRDNLWRGGAYYHGALVVMRGHLGDPNATSVAISKAVACGISYETQLKLLSEELGMRTVREPSLFVLSDRHPMSALKLKNTKVSVVMAPGRLSSIPHDAHSLGCGKVALFWRESLQGAALTVFCATDLVEQAAALQREVLRELGAATGLLPHFAKTHVWCRSLDAMKAPISEALSPVGPIPSV